MYGLFIKVCYISAYITFPGGMSAADAADGVGKGGVGCIDLRESGGESWTGKNRLNWS